jgi:hypothetical protein
LLRTPYKYAVIRVVPRVDRDEFINAGVIFYHPDRAYLKARTVLKDERLRALSLGADPKAIRRHLSGIERICAGDKQAGPIARLSKSERFEWLTSPRSTMIQTSPVKSGLADVSEDELDNLTLELVG